MFENGNLRGTFAGVIDHVGIRLPDLVAARAFYDLALRHVDGPTPTEAGGFREWNDFSIGEATPDRPVTRRLHIGFRAGERSQVDHWWQAMRERRVRKPRIPRPATGVQPHLLRRVHRRSGRQQHRSRLRRQSPRTDGTTIDHLWLRVRDLAASSLFYETIAPTVGYEVTRRPDRTRIHKDGSASFSLVAGDPTENLHLAFAAPDAATVHAFHRAGIEAGYGSLGLPGERPEYHPGYYGAYLADPDGNNLEAVFHGPPASAALVLTTGLESGQPDWLRRLRCSARLAVFRDPYAVRSGNE